MIHLVAERRPNTQSIGLTFSRPCSIASKPSGLTRPGKPSTPCLRAPWKSYVIIYSETEVSVPEPKTDRLSQPTVRALADARTALMKRKAFDAVTVQEILERVERRAHDVCARCLYMEDLLMKQVQRRVPELDAQALQGNAATTPILPSHAFFRHVRA